MVSTSKIKNYKEKEKVLLKILDKITEKNKSKSFKLSPKFVSEILWSLAINKTYNKESLKKIEKNVIETIHKMNEIDITQCFYAYCVFQSFSKKGTYIQILDMLVERMQSFKRKLNKKSKQLIEEGKKLCDYQNKSLNF